MRGRTIELLAVIAVMAVLVALAVASAPAPPSTYSTYDTGRNGYRALFEVLRREGIPVTRLETPLGQLDPGTRVFAVTPPLPAFGTKLPIRYDAADRARIERFLARGGTVLAFGAIDGMHRAKGLHVLDAAAYTNAALARDPRKALQIYRLVAGRGPVAFDERVHGYDRTRSLWSVLPGPVRAACWLAVLAVLIALVDANVRFVPPVEIEPAIDRDSSDYIRSMARLLRRARAGGAAIARFAHAYPQDAELRALAALTRPGEAAVLRAATIYSHRRKDRT